jgi:hypothetical protein
MEKTHENRRSQDSEPKVFAKGEQKVVVRIVVATEHRAYRDVISGTLRTLCPLAEVISVKPEDLDHEVVRLSPLVVICSLLSEAVETVAPAWIELYPQDSSRVTIGLGEKRTTLAKLDLEGILSVVNRAQEL